ncbi:MAG: winged helix-turn-helix transcriptional regulator [Methanomassiliicoccus sp.]|nr:winged helix-turn-helix transcriptional regulator [Methanomassiliicoccus sp.]
MVGFKVPNALPITGPAMKVELDKRSLFALASDTRLEILKVLQTNRRTVSQLAEVLGIDKAAVHRHLKKLEEGGFVARTEDHGFIYYALTWKSRDILNPNDRTRIVILISSTFICLLALAMAVFMASSSMSDHGAPAEQMSDGAGADGGVDRGVGAPEPAGLGWLISPMVLGAASAGLGALVWRSWKMPRQRGGETAYDRASASENGEGS